MNKKKTLLLLLGTLAAARLMQRHPAKWRRYATFFIATCAIWTWPTALFSQNLAAPPGFGAAAPAALAPFAVAASSTLNPAWQLTGLPLKQAVPRTRFEVLTLDGEPVLQVSTDKSYGVLTHAWHGPAPAQLAWRWRVDQPLVRADLTTKAGDDAALKVCVMFDQPVSDIPLLQRAGLALARAATGQAMPSATVCYVWDSRYPAATRGANPFTARVRYIVLDGLGARPGQWLTQRRQMADDFQQLFGAESPHTPSVIAVAVGADSDNTQDKSLAYLSHLRWLP